MNTLSKAPLTEVNFRLGWHITDETELEKVQYLHGDFFNEIKFLIKNTCPAIGPKFKKKPEESFHIKEGKAIVASIAICEAIRNPRNPKNKGKIEPAWAQIIIHDPISEKEDPKNGANLSHALIYGKKRGLVQPAIAKNCTWKNIIG